jgi:hypothetical protein
MLRVLCGCIANVASTHGNVNIYISMHTHTLSLPQSIQNLVGPYKEMIRTQLISYMYGYVCMCVYEQRQRLLR